MSAKVTSLPLGTEGIQFPVYIKAALTKIKEKKIAFVFAQIEMNP